MDQFLIKNTTKAEREKIVSDALGYDDIGCEGAAGASLFDMYQPYIDGEMELTEITKQFQAHYISADNGPEKAGKCAYQI